MMYWYRAVLYSLLGIGTLHIHWICGVGAIYHIAHNNFAFYAAYAAISTSTFIFTVWMIQNIESKKAKDEVVWR